MVCGKHDEDHRQNAQGKNGYLESAAQFPRQDGSKNEGKDSHGVKGRPGEHDPAPQLFIEKTL
jgi:hypothetical protein